MEEALHPIPPRTAEGAENNSCFGPCVVTGQVRTLQRAEGMVHLRKTIEHKATVRGTQSPSRRQGGKGEMPNILEKCTKCTGRQSVQTS